MGVGIPDIAPASTACGDVVPDFWQITLSRSDMPFTFTDAYRLHADGVLDFASWSSQREVQGVAGPVRLSESGARSFRAIATRRFTGTASDERAGRAAEGLEVGAYTAAGAAQSATDAVPDDVRGFLGSLKAKLPVTAAAPGTYVWTRPVAYSPLVDLDLAQGGCDGPVARAVADGLTAPRLLVPLASGAERYLTGDLSGRMEFVARLDSGFAAFGILRA